MTDILAHLFRHMADHFPPAAAPGASPSVGQASSHLLPAVADRNKDSHKVGGGSNNEVCHE